MGYPLRLCINRAGQQVWLDTTEQDDDVVLLWEGQSLIEKDDTLYMVTVIERRSGIVLNRFTYKSRAKAESKMRELQKDPKHERNPVWIEMLDIND